MLDGKYVTGFRPRELAGLLGVSPGPNPDAREGKDLLDTIDGLLSALHDYSLAVPSDQLKFLSPNVEHRISDMPASQR